VELSDLKDILRMLEKQDITEFELEQDGVKLRICRSGGAATVAGTAAPVIVASSLTPGVPASATEAPPSAAAAVAPPASPQTGETAAGSGAVEHGSVVSSPIVGTFYRAPDPNSPPFVNVGDRVEVGQVLCIIEAMKLMNEIEAEVAGEVSKIHPENGQPVQYGDALFTIRPS
jgi:acetyl-CoA carboxylase biotin carboxyl carrier protein